MTITAKYAATCSCCHNAVTPGQQIEWSKGSPVRHTSCPAIGGAGRRDSAIEYISPRVAARVAARSRGGKWTGCSCGSREDSSGTLIPSSRNCASCNHDA
jgi:hypothetical protein